MSMEWALHTAYFSQISDSLDPAVVPQEELLTMPVAFNDSVYIIDSVFPIFEIHRQSLPDYKGKVSIDLNGGGDIVLIYKQEHMVHHRKLSTDEAAFFNEIKNSENLLQVIEGLSGSIESEALSTTLGFMFEARLLKALT